MDQPTPQHDQARIRQRAYEIWMDEGTPDGRCEANWHQAEAELARADAPAQTLLLQPSRPDAAPAAPPVAPPHAPPDRAGSARRRSTR